MPQLLKILHLAGFLLINPVLAANYGYIESNDCVDPSGYAGCYEATKSDGDDCIDKNCKGQNNDCIRACDCALVTGVIDCAVTFCWNKVYSCEYQNTVLELGGNCIDEKFENVPFFPAPDDAPGACSCNLGKVITSINRATDELDTCIERNQETWDSLLLDIDGQTVFSKACKCCSMSSMLSTFWDVCPDTEPSLIGADDYWNGVISLDEDYPQCRDYTDVYSCANDLKFTPPGKDKSAKFYGPGEFPKNGTKTLSNMDGSITSPLSGATFTWTHHKILHPITVASADAKPTGSSNEKDDGNKDAKEIGKGNGEEEEEDVASLNVPHMWPLVLLVLDLLI